MNAVVRHTAEAGLRQRTVVESEAEAGALRWTIIEGSDTRLDKQMATYSTRLPSHLVLRYEFPEFYALTQQLFLK